MGIAFIGSGAAPKASRFAAAALLFLAAVVLQAPGCIHGRPERAADTVPAACAACHGTLAEVTGESHPAGAGPDMTACRFCHGTGGAPRLAPPVHLTHLSSPDFSGDCRSCHFIDADAGFGLIGDTAAGGAALHAVEKTIPYYDTWADSQHLDHAHALAGVGCTGCHESAFPDRGLTLEECLGCHGSYAKVAAATQNADPNPHDAHYTDLRCTLCHKAHAESELYCNTCHDFALDVP